MSDFNNEMFEDILKQAERDVEIFNKSEEGTGFRISSEDEDVILERMFLTYYVKEYLKLFKEKEEKLKRIHSSNSMDAPTADDIRLTTYYMGYECRDADLLGDGSLIPCFYDGEELLGTVIEVNLKPTSNLEDANLFLDILKKNKRFESLAFSYQSDGKWSGILKLKGYSAVSHTSDTLLEMINFSLNYFNFNFSRVPIK